MLLKGEVKEKIDNTWKKILYELLHRTNLQNIYNVIMPIHFPNRFITFDNLKNKITIYSWKHELEPKQTKQA